MTAFTLLYLLSYILATTLVLCFGFVLCFVAYIHYIHKINGHIPGPPRSSFILGHLPDIWKFKSTTGRIAAKYILEKRFEYGPVFVLFFCHRAVVFLGDSSYLRHVYVNNHKILQKDTLVYHKLGFIFGERGAGFGLVINTDEVLWRKRRRLMNPVFHRKCLREFMTNFNDVCDRFLAHINTVARDGEPASMVQEFAKVTLEAISQVSFNINTQAIEDPNSPFPAAIRNYLWGVQANLEIPISATFLSIFQLMLLQNDTKREQINAAKFIRKFGSDCIIARMKNIADGKQVPNDLLNILIKDDNLSMDDKIDEFITIFVAGQETTANSLSFTLYEIIRNPDVQTKLLNEINEVLGERDDVEYDDLVKFKYLGQVLEESLRKHPVALSPSRLLTKDLTVGGYHISRGTRISSMQLFFATNPEIWKDPEVFDPERFSNLENMQDMTMTHFPFSIGPRNCIGQTFAKFESKVILAKLLRKFQFDLLPDQTDRMEARLTLIPKDGVICKVIRREGDKTCRL